MTEPPVISEARSRKMVLAVIVILVALAALVITGVVAFFLLSQVRNRTATRNSGASPSAFLNVPERAVPGRYKWTDGPSEFFRVLYDDHTFMNRDGTTFPQYRWDIGPDGLSIQWQNSSSRFTNIEAPGVYMTVTTKGIARMEKLPPYTPSQLVPPKPIASIRLGAQCETNGLTPVNTESDGEIVWGKAVISSTTTGLKNLYLKGGTWPIHRRASVSGDLRRATMKAHPTPRHPPSPLHVLMSFSWVETYKGR